MRDCRLGQPLPGSATGLTGSCALSAGCWEDSRSICWYEHPSNFGGVSTRRLALTMCRDGYRAQTASLSAHSYSGSYRLCDLSSALVCSVLSRSLASLFTPRALHACIERLVGAALPVAPPLPRAPRLDLEPNKQPTQLEPSTRGGAFGSEPMVLTNGP